MVALSLFPGVGMTLHAVLQENAQAFPERTWSARQPLRV